jgi:hypothetical protein
MTYLRVKGGRGKFLLVRVYGVTGKYYRVGKIKEENLTFKSKFKGGEDKGICTFAITKNDVFQEMGVNCVEVDEEQGILIDKNYNVVNGQSPKRFDSILTRALQRPTLMDAKQQIILILLILIIVLQFVGIYFLYKILKMVTQLLAQGVAQATGVIQ